jgi:TPR repeat protein
MLDISRAIALYEGAWNDGVAFAGFRLGRLYEDGLKRSPAVADYLLTPNPDRAGFWYRKAAHAGEPDALARLAERHEDAALVAHDDTTRDAARLAAFRDYTAAAEQARREDWPDNAWRNWRYRRASLARLLAQDGMMELVVRGEPPED